MNYMVILTHRFRPFRLLGPSFFVRVSPGSAVILTRRVGGHSDPLIPNAFMHPDPSPVPKVYLSPYMSTISSSSSCSASARAASARSMAFW